MNPYLKYDLIDPWFFVWRTYETDCPLIFISPAVYTCFGEWDAWDQTNYFLEVITFLN